MSKKTIHPDDLIPKFKKGDIVIINGNCKMYVRGEDHRHKRKNGTWVIIYKLCPFNKNGSLNKRVINARTHFYDWPEDELQATNVTL